MKNSYKTALLAFAALLFAAGCGKDKIVFPETPTGGEETGYLVLSGMNLGVSADVETLVSGSDTEPITELGRAVLSSPSELAAPAPGAEH